MCGRHRVLSAQGGVREASWPLRLHGQTLFFVILPAPWAAGPFPVTLVVPQSAAKFGRCGESPERSTPPPGQPRCITMSEQLPVTSLDPTDDAFLLPALSDWESVFAWLDW